MDLDNYTLADLKHAEARLKAAVNNYSKMTSFQGGWMFWDGDKEDEAKRNLIEVQSEIRKREAKN